MKRTRKGQLVWHYVATHRRWGVVVTPGYRQTLVAYDAGGYETANTKDLAPASIDSIVQFQRIIEKHRKSRALNRIKRARKWAKYWDKTWGGT